MNKTSCATNDHLVDIKDICVDRSLPKCERIAEYVRQIKNPYRFKCGKYAIRARYANNGVTLEDRLRSILS